MARRTFQCYELRGDRATEFIMLVDRIAAIIPRDPTDTMKVGTDPIDYQSYEAWFADDKLPITLLLDLEALHRAAPWLLKMDLAQTAPDEKTLLGPMLLSQDHRTWQKNSCKTGYSLVRTALPRERKSFAVIGAVAQHHPLPAEMHHRARTQGPVIDAATVPH